MDIIAPGGGYEGPYLKLKFTVGLCGFAPSKKETENPERKASRFVSHEILKWSEQGASIFFYCFWFYFDLIFKIH